MTRPYRVVCRADDKVRWLAERHKLITGSDMSVVTGLAPGFFAKSKLDRKVYEGMDEGEKQQYLYDDLVRVKAGPVEPPLIPNRKMFWGTMCEQDNMKYFTQLTGARTRHCNVLFASTQHTRVGATTDGFVKAPDRCMMRLKEACSNPWAAEDFLGELVSRQGRQDLGLIEMKQTDPTTSDGYATWYSRFWKNNLEELDKKPPAYHWVQVQTGLYTMGLQWGVLVIRLGGSDIRCYVIRYSEELVQDVMLPAVDKFWEDVNGFL